MINDYTFIDFDGVILDSEKRMLERKGYEKATHLCTAVLEIVSLCNLLYDHSDRFGYGLSAGHKDYCK